MKAYRTLYFITWLIACGLAIYILFLDSNIDKLQNQVKELNKTNQLLKLSKQRELEYQDSLRIERMLLEDMKDTVLN